MQPCAALNIWYVKCIRKSSLSFLTTSILSIRRIASDISDKTQRSVNILLPKIRAVFIIGIGCRLSDGKNTISVRTMMTILQSTPKNNLPGLNGDLLVWDKVLDRSVNFLQWVIRGRQGSIASSTNLSGQEKRKELYFHKRLLEGTLPSVSEVSDNHVYVCSICKSTYWRNSSQHLARRWKNAHNWAYNSSDKLISPMLEHESDRFVLFIIHHIYKIFLSLGHI